MTSSRRPWVFSDVSSLRIAAWTAAPKMTASSGSIDLFGSVATEEVTGASGCENVSRTTDEDNFMHIHLVEVRVLEHLFYRLNSRTEEVLAQLLETGTGDGGSEVDAVEERVDFCHEPAF